MDTELLRTFLELNRTRHFGRAAENLFLTQSAVSARIRLLEETLGVALFTRTRNNIQLTPAGERLLDHAETILDAWTRARHEVAVSDRTDEVLAVAAVPSLGDLVLPEWLHALRAEVPRLALNVEVRDPATIARRLAERSLDLALVLERPPSPEHAGTPVAELRLVMVATRPGIGATAALGDGYVFVDWGTSFAGAHAEWFPDAAPPAMRVDGGRLAHTFLLEHGGAAYLAHGAVAGDLAAGRLHLVADAPVVERTAFAVHAAQGERAALVDAVVGILGRVGHEAAVEA